MIDRCEKTQENLKMVWHLSMGQQPRCQIEAQCGTYWWRTWIVPASKFHCPPQEGFMTGFFKGVFLFLGSMKSIGQQCDFMYRSMYLPF